MIERRCPEDEPWSASDERDTRLGYGRDPWKFGRDAWGRWGRGVATGLDDS